MVATMDAFPTVVLKRGRDKPVRGRHPWIFSGAVESVEGEALPGAVARVRTAEWEQLGWAGLSPRSQILARMLSWQPEAVINEAFWRERLAAALALRAALPDRPLADPDGACRLVYAESDGLPGLIIDRYGPFLVLQALTAGIEPWKERLAAWAAEAYRAATGRDCAGVYERSDVDVRAKEGLAEQKGPLWGEAPPPRLWVREALGEAGTAMGAVADEGARDPAVDAAAAAASVWLPVDIAGGHKTGAYLDQAVNRRRVAAYAAGRRVLNLFCYTGGFGLHAVAAGAASLTQLDSSAGALAAAAEALGRRGGDAVAGAEWVEADAFTQLRRWRDAGGSWDLIILDPPKFVQNAGQIAKASRAYKDINLLALKLLAPGGILASFSCSGLVGGDLFLQILHGAALDAGRELAVLEPLSQAPDHPVRLSFPEGRYLKGLLGRVG